MKQYEFKLEMQSVKGIYNILHSFRLLKYTYKIVITNNKEFKCPSMLLYINFFTT